MEKISKTLLKFKTIIIALFIIATTVSVFLISDVKINYNLSAYLPKDIESLVAVEEISKSYDATLPNIKLVIPDVSIEEATRYKMELLNVEGVNQVVWLDDFAHLIDKDSLAPIELEAFVSDWHKDNNALLLLNIETDNSKQIIKDIRSVVKSGSLLAGDAVNVAAAQDSVTGEMANIMLVTLPIIILILLLTTSSWFEPVLFLITIAVAIVINLGTNVLFGEISFITQAAVVILQLAVSMDYGIFLLHRFTDVRDEGKSVEDSMRVALRDSASVITGSALTTILGFLALTIMKFKIGFDLGLVLAKGIGLSLLSVMVLLPVLAVWTHKIIDKTKHKSIMPSFKKMGELIIKVRYVILVVVILLIIPSFIASQKNNFLYGSSGINSEDSQIQKDTRAINETFGANNQIVVLVPKGDFEKEMELVKELQQLKPVVNIKSFVTTFGLDVPMEYLPKDAVEQFISEKYSQIVLKTDLEEESLETFEFIEKSREIVSNYYDDEYHLAGISAVNYDMMKVVSGDNLKVNIAAILSIVFVLIVIFKSILTPLILISAIEIAIWINLSITYLYGVPLNYIGFLIVSTVQLGATVDYAILFGKKYLNNRSVMDKNKASIETIATVAPSILSSASILAIAGFGLGFVSTNGVISQLGTLVGRGAVISAIMVLLFVPALFIVFDKQIGKLVNKK